MTWDQIEAADRWAVRQQRRMEALGKSRILSEATPAARAATGASGGYWDPVDQDLNYRRAGRGGPREVPERTREIAVMDSIVAGRSNPMGVGIIATYVAFCVGDSGLTLNCSSDEVRPVAEQHWADHRNRYKLGMERMFRTWMVMGEQLQEMMVGEYSGRVRRSPIDTSRICDVTLRDGNPLWPELVRLRTNGQHTDDLRVVDLDDETGLRAGDAMFWPAFQLLETDTRGVPFLMPALDWLDSYDQVLSNLIDRTALSRYIVWDVSVDGDQDDVDREATAIGKRGVPRSGTTNVHNSKVTWEPKTATVGAQEDTTTAGTTLTSVAAATGLAKPWLAEPEDANRATSLTMAEPVRRRVGSVQKEWLANITEMQRFAIDRAVAVGRIPATVSVRTEGGGEIRMAAADTVTITGPQIAAADAEMTAQVLVHLGQALTDLVAVGAMSPKAAQIAARKGWENFVGVPYTAELDQPDGSRADDVAQLALDHGARVPLVAV